MDRNFIKIPTPDSVAGMKFPDALKALHEKDQTILIGVESDGKRLVNPKDHVLRKEDQIFVVS